MKALLQRVRQASVTVDGQLTGEIGPGLLVLFCAEPQDDEAVADRLLAKIFKLRIFADDAGKMNRSVQDVRGGLLLVSQFTLAADCSGGNRPALPLPHRLRRGRPCSTIPSGRPVRSMRRWRPAFSEPTCR